MGLDGKASIAGRCRQTMSDSERELQAGPMGYLQALSICLVLLAIPLEITELCKVTPNIMDFCGSSA